MVVATYDLPDGSPPASWSSRPFVLGSLGSVLLDSGRFIAVPTLIVSLRLAIRIACWIVTEAVRPQSPWRPSLATSVTHFTLAVPASVVLDPSADAQPCCLRAARVRRRAGTDPSHPSSTKVARTSDRSTPPTTFSRSPRRRAATSCSPPSDQPAAATASEPTWSCRLPRRSSPTSSAVVDAAARSGNRDCPFGYEFHGQAPDGDRRRPPDTAVSDPRCTCVSAASGRSRAEQLSRSSDNRPRMRRSDQADRRRRSPRTACPTAPRCCVVDRGATVTRVGRHHDISSVRHVDLSRTHAFST